MQRYFELARALEYIEIHLLENFKQEDVARAAYVSLSALLKMFRYTFGCSVNEYISKRKMTVAAEELMSSNKPLYEMAFKYGYTSTEAFSRAFSKVNCCLPSDFRKGKKTQAVFTSLTAENGDIIRTSPIALIEAIKNSINCYVVCFDIAGIMDINAISREAGDIALLEAVSRIRQYISNNIPFFRIGGDEFVLITPFNYIEDAEHLASSVLSHNGETFTYKELQIPLYLRSWYGKNSFAIGSENPAVILREKVKYQGFTEVRSDE